MRTILYPDGNLPEPYLKNSRDNDYTLYILTAILILFFWCLFLWHYRSVSTTVLEECPPGECPTNIKTGQKRCAEPHTVLLRDLETEVCNPRNACTSSFTPYALNTDGSFNSDGVCENGSTCRCTSQISCPFFAETLFTRSSPTPNLLDANYYYAQSLIGSPQTGTTPTTFTDPFRQSCYITLPETARLNPALCVSFSTPKDIVACVQSNPCLSGRLTFVPERGSSSFDVKNMVSTSMACIASEACASNQVPVLDWKSGQTYCLTVPGV